MPTDAFEETADLKIGLLESVRPASPYPLLRPTGQIESRSFHAVLLENAYLRVTILPGLGGRILSIFDKRTSTEILEPAPLLDAKPDGPRGARLSAGIQLLLDGQDRPNDLGPVDFQIEEPPEAVWIAETSGGTGFSFHLRIELPPERAELRLEARILNRTRRPLHYNGALSFDLGPAEFDGETAYSADRHAGLRLHSDKLEHAEFDNGRLIRSRFSEPGILGPRQVDSWTAVLTPFSGLDELPFVNEAAAIVLNEDKVQVQSVEPSPGAALFLGLEDGQTMEAAADLYPEHVLEIPLDGLPARAVLLAIKDANRQEIFRYEPATPRPLPVGSAAPLTLPDPNVTSLDGKALHRLTFSPAHRALAFLELGHRALAAGEFAQADEHLENALLYNADDPLNWWTKAMARRLAGAEDESPELPNAHYLAPIEPALRAEAFLAQPHSQGREGNPLIAPLADKPEALVEIAALLLEIGVRAEASRWIDEALRHRDVAMLRYLAAWSLLQGSRMEAEAAVQVAAAAKLPFDPPYPWREIERTALRDLAAKFPADPQLANYLKLVREQ